MGTNVILAINPGRYNSVVCWYGRGTCAAEYRTVHSFPKELRQALTQRLVSSVVLTCPLLALWAVDLHIGWIRISKAGHDDWETQRAYLNMEAR